MQLPKRISSDNLQLADVPQDTDTWQVIGLFALTFDPKEDDLMKLNKESLESLSGVSNMKRIRAHLFLEQRRWNHYGRMPDEEAMRQIRDLILLIRVKLSEPIAG
jgi:hypothetical protein